MLVCHYQRTSVKIIKKYSNRGVSYAIKSFIILTLVANVINFFSCNYTTISVISVKLVRKYTNSGIGYTIKRFITLTPGCTLEREGLKSLLTCLPSPTEPIGTCWLVSTPFKGCITTLYLLRNLLMCPIS